MTHPCDWPCDKPAVAEAGGWHHCAEHLAEHYLQEGAPEVRCGTPSGADAHRRRKEPVCADCKAAKNRAQADYYRRKKATGGTYYPTTVDEAVVTRRISGDRSVPMNQKEMWEAVRRLHATGASDRQIGRTLGVDSNTVLRIRSRFGLPANVPSGRREAS